jgi:hypothetical protein
MLPFAMRSAPIPAGVAGSASSVPLATRAPQPTARKVASFSVATRFSRPLFSYRYKLLFRQLLCFDNHLRCPIVFLVLSRNPVFSAVNKPLTPVLAYCCGLFLALGLVNSFAIKQIRTLFGKHRGWGCFVGLNLSTRGRSGARQPSATWMRPAHPTIIAVTSGSQVHG